MEKQLAEFLPGFSKIAADGELRELISRHADRTVEHKARLLAVFANHRVRIGGDAGEALRGLISGASMELANMKDPATRDLLLAGHCKRIGDKGINTYIAAACMAKTMGYQAEWDLLVSFYSEQEKTIIRLDGIGARLLNGQIRRGRYFSML